MPLPHSLPAVLGSISVLATTAVLVIYIILAQSLPDPSSPVRTTAVLSSIFEAFVLVALSFIFSLYVGTWSRDPFKAHNGVWFGVFALLCAVSAVLSAATMVCLNQAARNLPGTTTIMGSKPISFLVGASVALGLAFAAQLFFLVAHFVLARMHGLGPRAESAEEGARERRMIPQMSTVKSIPYSQTSPATTRPRGSSSVSASSRSPPGSSGSRSTAETMHSIRSSLSQVVRPITSKTRLVSNSSRSPRRPASIDTNAYRTSAGDDAFDSWDTSAVDPQNRQTVLQSSGSITGRFLETIPASPTTSRSPSPGTPLDFLEPPKQLRSRSRSYSPGPSRVRSFSQSSNALTPPLTQQSNSSESHIHPLFRSDSPTPPPAVITAGTVVTAAPNAGLLISADAQSIRTLTRMRSGSLPTVPSPLSRQGSVEDFAAARRAEREELRLPEQLREEAEEDEEEQQERGGRREREGEEEGEGEEERRRRREGEEEPEERKLTPPIPDWIMTAGARTSLYGYNSRKARAGEDEGVEQPVRQP